MGCKARVAGWAAVCAVLLPAGCASIMSGRHAEVSIRSNVPQARVVVRDKRGEQVAAGNAPASFSLRRKDKFIFPARYTATIAAPGYTPVTVPIRPTINPWVLGNVVLGGPVGLVVDNVTGAAWQPGQSEVFGELTPARSGGASLQTASLPADTEVQPAAGEY